MKKNITLTLSALTLTLFTAEVANAQIGSSVTINKSAVATVAAPDNQSACAGALVDAMPITGNADSFYISGGAALGLADQGFTNAEIPAFTAIAGDDATITITPYNNECAGTSVNYTLSVIAAPSVNTVADFAVCSGGVIELNFTGTPGATFDWTNDNMVTGIDASGNGNINVVASGAGTSTITVTPSLGACTGDATVVSAITVNALPSNGTLAAINTDICSSDQATLVFTSSENITSISYTINGGDAQVHAITTPASETFDVPSSEGSNEYTLISMTDENGCTAQ
jgi:hypothetical protein